MTNNPPGYLFITNSYIILYSKAFHHIFTHTHTAPAKAGYGCAFQYSAFSAILK
jgi:hypothetical protein